MTVDNKTVITGYGWVIVVGTAVVSNIDVYLKVPFQLFPRLLQAVLRDHCRQKCICCSPGGFNGFHTNEYTIRYKETSLLKLNYLLELELKREIRT